MFILRSISQISGDQQNEVIGDNYTLTYKNDLKNFKTCYRNHFGHDFEDPSYDGHCKSTYCFIVTNQKLIPLFEGDNNYVMSDSGKTFDNLTK